MGIRSHYIITDPAFSEFVYFKMINCPPEVRGRLNHSELKYFRNKKSIRAFADNEPMERRILMLTRMGVKWTTIFYTDETDMDLFFREIDESYTYSKKNKDLLDYMRKGALFVFGSKSLMMMQLLAEHGSHSRNYVLDYQYNKTNKLLTGQKDLRRESKIYDADQTYVDLARIVYQSVTCFSNMLGDRGATPLNMKILLVLMSYRNDFVTIRTMLHKLGIPMSNRAIQKTIGNMVKREHIYETKVPELEWDQKAYTISEKGIDLAMDFLRYVQQKIHDTN